MMFKNAKFQIVNYELFRIAECLKIKAQLMVI